jgi:4-amino-4-deoxy-L-arabinose transferase-like glycosyltransferase
LHGVLGASTVLLVFLMAGAIGRRAAWIAAGLMAVDPLLLQQSSLAMTETLAVLLATATLAIFQLTENQPRQRVAHVARGLCVGLAILCRPTFLVWGALLTLASGLRQPRRLGGAALMVLTIAVMLLPWTLRNWRYLGKPIYSTTHGGYTLWLANNPEFFDYLRRPGRPPQWDSANFDRDHFAILEQSHFDEVRTDRQCYANAWQTIQERPADFAWATLVRIGRMWRLAPHASNNGETWQVKAVRYTVGIWYAAVFLLAARGWWLRPDLRRRSPYAQGLLLAVALTLVHALFWSNLRMRAPIMPWLALWAAVGLTANNINLLNWLSGRSQHAALEPKQA